VSSATATAPQQVFISYRREESAAYAGRIYDAMAARFGDKNVFMDVEMPPGVDFVDQIDKVLAGCAALIVVIGPRWAELTDGNGRTRLEDADDFVRREVAAALRRDDVTVIPALVAGAMMPGPEELPEDLHPLTRRNALELSHTRWRYDVGRLHEVLDGLIPLPPPALSTPLERPPERSASIAMPTSWAAALRLLVEGILLAAVAGFAGRYLGELTRELNGGTAAEIAEVALQRAAAWGVVGLALGPWLGWRLGRRDLAYLALLGLLAGVLAGIAGGLIYGFPHKLPDPNVKSNMEPGWGVLSLAATGAVIGALLGAVEIPHRLPVGLAGGLLGGVLIRLFLNGYGWTGNQVPEIAYSFAVAAAAMAAGALLALLAAESVLSSRSSAAATAPGSR
jgi:hypothetical protein